MSTEYREKYEACMLMKRLQSTREEAIGPVEDRMRGISRSSAKAWYELMDRVKVVFDKYPYLNSTWMLHWESPK